MRASAVDHEMLRAARPPARCEDLQLEGRAVHTVIGLAPPHYALRVSVYPYGTVEGAIFFASRAVA